MIVISIFLFNKKMDFQYPFFFMFKGSIKLLSLILFPISVFSNADTVSLKNIEHAQSGL